MDKAEVRFVCLQVDIAGGPPVFLWAVIADPLVFLRTDKVGGLLACSWLDIVVDPFDSSWTDTVEDRFVFSLVDIGGEVFVSPNSFGTDKPSTTSERSVQSWEDLYFDLRNSCLVVLFSSVFSFHFKPIFFFSPAMIGSLFESFVS